MTNAVTTRHCAPDALVSIDLVRASFRSDDVPADWDESHRSRVADRYVKFLSLIAAHPGRAFAPTREIDLFWHLHMLHPRAYQRDCAALFGGVLDHDGGFGKDPAELPVLQRTFDRTATLWESRYGEPYVAGSEDPRITNCWHDCSGRCWHACQSDDDDDVRSVFA